ncbi:serine/threonine-protein kinase WNK (With No Lysine)-like protein [Wolffia australiana]
MYYRNRKLPEASHSKATFPSQFFLFPFPLIFSCTILKNRTSFKCRLADESCFVGYHAMESAVKAALRRLCALHGWLYGVFLQADLGDPGLLAPVEIYYEGRTSSAIVNSLRRVYRLGEGTGERFRNVILSGGHRWIFSDALPFDGSSHSAKVESTSSWKIDLPELGLLFLAGVKTVAAVSLLPFGVVLFGSDNKVPESSHLVNQIRHSFRKLGNTHGHLIRQTHQRSTMTNESRGLSSLVLPSNLVNTNRYTVMASPAFPNHGSLESESFYPADQWLPSPALDSLNFSDWAYSSESGNLRDLLPLSSLDLDADCSLGNGTSAGDFEGLLCDFDFDSRRDFQAPPIWDNIFNEASFPEMGTIDSYNSHSSAACSPRLVRTLTEVETFGQRSSDGGRGKVGESSEGKAQKKRARPGDSARPRPKDRQQIQDRVKELRELVPNGSKCSIDALLARTVNHMLFLRGVIKYADQIKQADEPKMISESGIILKDDSGGATWAYEMAGQTITCPASIEELNPLGHMLIEILCEDHGYFLEIADSIRGFGLTILKGIMEARGRRIWARFLVEAHRSTNRMEIFLHLVQLLAKKSCSSGILKDQGRSIDYATNGALTAYPQSLMAVPSRSLDRGR